MYRISISSSAVAVTARVNSVVVSDIAQFCQQYVSRTSAAAAVNGRQDSATEATPWPHTELAVRLAKPHA